MRFTEVGARGRTGAALVVVAVALAAFAASAQARPGDLDPRFSRDGRVRTSLGEFSYAAGVAIQPDGKIVIEGNSDGRAVIARYRRNGRLDPTFSQNGLLRKRFGGDSWARNLVIQPDGRILASVGTRQDSVLFRLRPSGVLDRSFSGDGVLVTDFGSDVTLDRDGRIVVAGTRSGDAALARLEPDGTPDTSFSGDGVATVSFAGYAGSRGLSVAVGPDGNPVLGGESSNPPSPGNPYELPDVALARFQPDGDLDPSFSGDGTTTLSFGPSDWLSEIALRPDGRIVEAGGSCSHPDDFPGGCSEYVAQFDPDGSLDDSFGEGGVFRPGPDIGESLDSPALTEGGDTVLAGSTWTEYGSPVDFAIARLDATGSLDASFGGRGFLATDFLSERDSASDVALQPNGKIVAVGRSDALGWRSSGFDHRWGFDRPRIALARYEVARGPRDADADGVRDRADRCPLRFGRDRGCRSYRRSLTMKRGKDLFRGVLSSPDANCIHDETVRVLKARSGRDKKVGTTETDGRGRWLVNARRRPGRYYAKAFPSQSTLGEAGGYTDEKGGSKFGRCLKARSAVVAVGR